MASTHSGNMTGNKPQSANHSHPHKTHHFRHLVRSDGRRVYVANDPVEADKLRREISNHDSEAEFVIHGSDEHLSTLRHVHSFHEERRKAYQKRHGEHFTELEAAIRDMDAVREELHGLEERVVELDAAAEKYGYDSHVRLRDQANQRHLSTITSTQDFEKERRNAKSIDFFTKPILRQYYHKGLLWRANKIHEAGPYELFVDLVYVGVIAIAGDSAVEHANGHSLLRFAVTFLIGWKFWSEISIYTDWFVQEDILKRLCVLFVLVCLVGFTVNMEGFFDNTYTAIVAFYIVADVMSALSWLFYAMLLPNIRATLVSNTALIFLTVPLWVGSIFVDGGARYALVWISLFVDILGYEIKWGLVFAGHKVGSERVRSWVSRKFEYIPAISVEHMVARYDAFVTLVLGYSVVSLLYQSAVSNPMNNFFTKAILGLLQVFAVNSLYFEMDSFNLYTHAIRRHNRVFVFAWKTAHIPFVMSFVVAGATISRLVLAHDCPRCPIDALSESYAVKSQDNIESGQRWFYCAGLGISIICTVIIASMHTYKEPVGDWVFRHSKSIRLGLRAIVGLVIILLPLTGDALDSVALIATTTVLLHFCLFTDLAGNMLYIRFCPTAKLDPEEATTHSIQAP